MTVTPAAGDQPPPAASQPKTPKQVILVFKTAPAGPTVQPCDLRGRVAGAALPTSNHAFEVRLEPFAPTSIRLR